MRSGLCAAVWDPLRPGQVRCPRRNIPTGPNPTLGPRPCPLGCSEPGMTRPVHAWARPGVSRGTGAGAGARAACRPSIGDPVDTECLPWTWLQTATRCDWQPGITLLLIFVHHNKHFAGHVACTVISIVKEWVPGQPPCRRPLSMFGIEIFLSIVSWVYPFVVDTMASFEFMMLRLLVS